MKIQAFAPPAPIYAPLTPQAWGEPGAHSSVPLPPNLESQGGESHQEVYAYRKKYTPGHSSLPPNLGGRGGANRGALRRIHLLFALLLLLPILIGCQAKPSPAPDTLNPAPAPPTVPKQSIGKLVVPPNQPFPRTITDARGKQLTLKAPPKRIVSLAPSTTEILFALGLGDKVVADTTACDYPPEAKTKPHIGGFQTDIEAVQVQNPDLVVGDAVYNQKAIEALDHANVPTLALSAKTLNEVTDAIRLVGTATGQDMQAAKVIQSMEADIEALRRATAASPTKPKVLIIHEVKPTIYTTGSGSFIDELITAAGGQNIVTAPMPAGSTISAEQVLTLQPDVIITSPDQIAQIKQMPGWATGVPAVRDGRFFTPSDQALIERPGPRLAQGADELAQYLHPDIFDRSR